MGGGNEEPRLRQEWRHSLCVHSVLEIACKDLVNSGLFESSFPVNVPARV